MANRTPKKQDLATIAPFSIAAKDKAALEQIAAANNRDLTKQLRSLIQDCIAQYERDAA